MTTPTRPRRRRYDKRTIRREVVTFKASKDEKVRWAAAADAAGLSLGAWLARLADLASGLSGGSETGE
ncbi:MAG: hypothetical protein GTN69_02470 [Armatimonadetes bacterium]|nr:hypothetical protein [Armatimonadota bacterium]